MLDNNIDPSKSIILDISITDNAKKGGQTSKLNQSSRVQEPKNVREFYLFLGTQKQENTIAENPEYKRNTFTKKRHQEQEGRTADDQLRVVSLQLSHRSSPQPWNSKPSALRKEIQDKTARER